MNNQTLFDRGCRLFVLTHLAAMFQNYMLFVSECGRLVVFVLSM
jgi:hypothetical protein